MYPSLKIVPLTFGVLLNNMLEKECANEEGTFHEESGLENVYNHLNLFFDAISHTLVLLRVFIPVAGSIQDQP